MAEDIGGYFARLRLVVDQEDFNQGIRSLSMLSVEIKQASDKTAVAKNNWRDFIVGLAASIYTIKSVVGALKDMYDVLGNVLKVNKDTTTTAFTAAGMNISPIQLKEFQMMGGLFGIKPEAMNAQAQQMADAMGMITKGFLDTNQALFMSFMNRDISTEMGKPAITVFQDIITSALAQARAIPANAPDRTQRIEGIDAIVRKLTGEPGATIFSALLSGRTQYNMPTDAMSEAKRINFLNQGGVQGAVEYEMAHNKLAELWKSLMQQLGGSIGNDLAPIIERLVNDLVTHKDEIEAAIVAIAGLIGAIAQLGVTILELLGKNDVLGKFTANIENATIITKYGLAKPWSDEDKQKYAINYRKIWGRQPGESLSSIVDPYLRMVLDVENKANYSMYDPAYRAKLPTTYSNIFSMRADPNWRHERAVTQTNNIYMELGGSVSQNEVVREYQIKLEQASLEAMRKATANAGQQ